MGEQKNELKPDEPKPDEPKPAEKFAFRHKYGELSAEELLALLEDSSISKNQKKKIKKELDWINSADERRLRRKKRKLEMKEKRREKFANNEVPMIKKKKLNKVKSEDFDDHVHIGIDCSFDDLMTNKDIRKLAGQISWCYKINRRCEEPVQYHVFGMSERISKFLDPSFKRWDIHLDPYLSKSSLPKEKIVYLVAESENILDEVQTDTMYVIGGLVDHNHHKGNCFQIATKFGYKTARLPLTENVDMSTRRVLTVNHVFELLLAKRELKDWKKAILKVLPQKKIDSIKNDIQAVSKKANNESKKDLSEK